MINYEELIKECLIQFPKLSIFNISYEVYDYNEWRLSQSENSKETLLVRKKKPIASVASKYNIKKKNTINEYDYIISISNLETDKRFDEDMTFDFVTRYGQYLNAINVDINTKTIFLCILLHEIGHIEFSRLFYKNSSNNFIRKSLYRVTDIFAASHFGVSKNSEIDEEYGTSIAYLCNGEEMFCDNFVFRNFKEIWDKVKHI